MSEQFKCKSCTLCCKQFRINALNEPQLIEKFEEKFGFKLKDYKINVLFEGECEHLLKGRCAIHNTKPKRCKEFFCKRYTALDVQPDTLYKKRCRVCQKVRSFQKGKERDRQSVCGNCWVW